MEKVSSIKQNDFTDLLTNTHKSLISFHFHTVHGPHQDPAEHVSWSFFAKPVNSQMFFGMLFLNDHFAQFTELKTPEKMAIYLGCKFKCNTFLIHLNSNNH